VTGVLFLHTPQVLLLAVPPVVPSPGRPGAEVDHLQQLGSAVDGFSLMTYDYSASGSGPSSPLPWQQQNVKELMAEAGSNKGRTQGEAPAAADASVQCQSCLPCSCLLLQ